MQTTINTNESKEVIDITDRVTEFVAGSDESNGRCMIFVMHTTAAVTTADLDPGTDKDMLEAFYEMIPDLDYRHPHDPDHVPDHILATLIGPDLLVPVKEGELELGTWQRTVLFEFDGPRERTLHFNFYHG